MDEIKMNRSGNRNGTNRTGSNRNGTGRTGTNIPATGRTDTSRSGYRTNSNSSSSSIERMNARRAQEERIQAQKELLKKQRAANAKKKPLSKREKKEQIIRRQNERIAGNENFGRAMRDTRIIRKKKGKKFNYRMQRKLTFVFMIVFIVAFVVIGYIAKTTFVDGEKYKKSALGQQTYTSTDIAYRRGDILDRNGTVLATSIKKYNIAIDPKYILTTNDKSEYIYKDAAVEVLASFLETSKEDVEKTIDEHKDLRHFVIAKKVSVDKKEDLDTKISEYKTKNKKSVKGIMSEVVYDREYPLKDVGSSVVGFVFDNDAGGWGIEGYYNSQLKGSTGKEYGYYDSELNLVSNTIEPTDGNTVVSTIDSNIQRIVQENIDKFLVDVGCSNAAVVVADPNNGEILAMASSNGIYDLNNPTDLSRYYDEETIAELQKDENKEKLTDALNTMWKNYCVTEIYEPGSTYKPFIVAGGLMENILKGNEKYFCDGKEVVVAGTNPIHCANRNGHGHITLEQALMYSCNDALMAIGSAMGAENVAKYQNVFGFGQKTGIDAVGEGIGIIRTAKQLKPVELATTSFGQGVNVTMIQMVAAFSSLINGGNYYTPHLVKQILNENGATVENVSPVLVKHTVSKNVSELLKKYLYATVQNGTAKYAKVDGYTIGGKTGTAQKLTTDENGKTIRDPENYLVSFIGFAPADNPQVVIYAIVDEPHAEKQSNSQFAQELAGGILKDILPFLGVYPSTTATPGYYNPDDYTGITVPKKGLTEDGDDADNKGDSEDGDNSEDGNNTNDSDGNKNDGNNTDDEDDATDNTENTPQITNGQLPAEFDESQLDFDVLGEDMVLGEGSDRTEADEAAVASEENVSEDKADDSKEEAKEDSPKPEDA